MKISGNTSAWLTLALLTLVVGSSAGPVRGQTTPERTKGPIEILLEEIDDLQEEIHALRMQLAQARTDAATAERELAELRQFIDDNHELGQDFAQYTAVKAIAEREARRRLAE